MSSEVRNPNAGDTNDQWRAFGLQLSECAWKIHEFRHSGSCKGMGNFEALVRNAPHLEKVELRFNYSDRLQDICIFHVRVEETVAAFLESAYLRELLLSDARDDGEWVEFHCRYMSSSSTEKKA